MAGEEFSFSKFMMDAINRAVDHAAASIKAEKDRENKKDLMGGSKTRKIKKRNKGKQGKPRTKIKKNTRKTMK
jgi:hypothetical protein